MFWGSAYLCKLSRQPLDATMIVTQITKTLPPRAILTWSATIKVVFETALKEAGLLAHQFTSSLWIHFGCNLIKCRKEVICRFGHQELLAHWVTTHVDESWGFESLSSFGIRNEQYLRFSNNIGMISNLEGFPPSGSSFSGSECDSKKLFLPGYCFLIPNSATTGWIMTIVHDVRVIARYAILLSSSLSISRFGVAIGTNPRGVTKPNRY